MLLAGREASLRGRPGLDVVRIEAPRSDDDPHLDGLRPDVVIVDLATAHAAGLCASLQEHPGLPLIGLDSNSSVISVLSRGWCSNRSISSRT